jgi:hypothetical protein
MTARELIEKQIKEEGNKYRKSHIVFPEGFISPVQNALDAYNNLANTMQGPLLEIIQMTEKTIKPHLAMIAEANKPGEGFITKLLPQRVVVENLEDFGISTNKNKESGVLTASYVLPKNAVWENLDIYFVDGHVVKVSYLGLKTKTFDFKDMGFMNIKNSKPNRKWSLLLAMAENGGSLTNSKWSRMFNRNIKYELNETLKRFFGMKENPIPHYTKKDGYEPLFRVHGERK